MYVLWLGTKLLIVFDFDLLNEVERNIEITTTSEKIGIRIVTTLDSELVINFS